TDLQSMGQPKPNPYDFSQEDVAAIDSLYADAQAKADELRDMLFRDDFTDIDKYIPSQGQIDSTRIYYNAQVDSINTVRLPFWEAQRTLARRMDIQPWVTVCNTMIYRLQEELTVIAEILHNADLDEAVINGTSSEDGRDIALRKLHLEGTTKSNYYYRLGRAITLAMELTIPDYSGLGDFISSQEQINEGRPYWAAQADTINTVSIPYWQSQRTLGENQNMPDLVSVANNMIASLNEQLSLIQSIQNNFNLDEAIINGTSTETPQAIVARKIALENQKITYYTNLISVINQAMELTIPDYSGLGDFISS
ncbi:MAG TPA: hypothetical protein PLC32_00010, partial [Candidatus Omnitrophota bacterium]|nr:hypothetical protein [Candidatus Omnitrophota bacterium]